jgi:hypothetical protein
MARLGRVSLAVLLLLLPALAVGGQTEGSSADPTKGSLDREELKTALATSGLTNGDLAAAVESVISGTLLGEGVITQGALILVDIHHSLSRSELEAQVAAVRGTLYQHISDAYAEAFVPAEMMRRLQDAPGVIALFLPPTPVRDPVPETLSPLAGSVNSQSVPKANAPAWHANGYLGGGVAVGIIDVFDGAVWNQARASGNVPDPASTFCRVGGGACNVFTATPGAVHGTGVAEIVHDMAPGASLHLALAATAGDYISAVNHFAARGVDIINHSATWPFDGPGDGTGPAADIIDHAASRGILWVNAGGNFGNFGYWRGVWTDTNANDRHEFGPGDESMGFFCHPGLGLRWDDWTGGQATDYDVYIYDDPGLTILKAFSLDFQGGGQPPIEDYGDSLLGAGCEPNDVDYLTIELFSPGAEIGDTLELGIFSEGEYSTVGHSAAIPFGDSFSPSMVSVGAVDPPNGTAAAAYSSRGPTNDGRTKPDLSAAAGVSSLSFGVFNGTSASAPALAGAAALLYDGGLINSATAGVDYLLSGAATVGRGPAGVDNTYGVGELRLPAPPPSVGDSVGLVDPATGAWHLRGQGGATNSFFYGNPGDFPMVGDWDCDGVETPGLYRQSDGFVYLRNSNTQGVADIRFFFGNPGDIPLAGDFDGNGCDTVSIYRAPESRIYVINALGANDGGLGAADFNYVFGNPGDKPFVGDFDGNGVDTVGLHRESTGFVYFRNTHTQGNANAQFFFGDPGDRLVAGDWGVIDGTDTPAVFRPTDATFYFRFTNTQGNANLALPFGEPSFLPVAGDFSP